MVVANVARTEKSSDPCLRCVSPIEFKTIKQLSHASLPRGTRLYAALMPSISISESNCSRGCRLGCVVRKHTNCTVSAAATGKSKGRVWLVRTRSLSLEKWSWTNRISPLARQNNPNIVDAARGTPARRLSDDQAVDAGGRLAIHRANGQAVSGTRHGLHRERQGTRPHGVVRQGVRRAPDADGRRSRRQGA